MSMSTEKGRQAAHVLLDAVSAMRDGKDAEPSNLAYQRLVDLDAFAVRVSDDGEGPLGVELDLSDILGATLITIGWLSDELADARGTSREAEIVRLREFLDAHFGDRPGAGEV